MSTYGSKFGVEDDSAQHKAAVLDFEEQELWKQLRRKRDFEGRVTDKLGQLQDLRERRRKLGGAHAEVATSVEHLTSELMFVAEQEREVEKDIESLAESNKILSHAMAEREGLCTGPHGGHRDPAAILAEEKRRQEAIQQQVEQIQSLRKYLEKLRAEKAQLLPRQQLLFEKQRSAEQDRNRLLGTLQDDRNNINEVRAERIRLWEERTKLERMLHDMMSEGNFNYPISEPLPTPPVGTRPAMGSQGYADSPSMGRAGQGGGGYPNSNGPTYGGLGSMSGRGLDYNSNNHLDDGHGGISEWTDRLRGARGSSNRAF